MRHDRDVSKCIFPHEKVINYPLLCYSNLAVLQKIHPDESVKERRAVISLK